VSPFLSTEEHPAPEGLLFYRLVQQAIQMDAVPFDQIRGGNPNL